MTTIHHPLNNYVGNQASGEAQGTSEAEATQVTGLQGVAGTPPADPLSLSGFDGVRTGQGHNVLSTLPPALGGGQTDSVSLAEALGRMQQFESAAPFTDALVRSTEDGTAPAAPKTTAQVGASASGSGAAAVDDSKNLTADKTTADADAEQLSGGLAADGQTVHVDISNLDADLQKAADKITEDAQVVNTKKCASPRNVGEANLTKNLQALGMNKDDAKRLARTMNNNNNDRDVSHQLGEQAIVAASLAAYNKLNGGFSKPNSEGAKQIAEQLKQAASSLKNANNNTEANQSYNRAINALGDFALQASTANAKAGFTRSAALDYDIVPYSPLASG